jgi:hypothetical protein
VKPAPVRPGPSAPSGPGNSGGTPTPGPSQPVAPAPSAPTPSPDAPPATETGKPKDASPEPAEEAEKDKEKDAKASSEAGAIAFEEIGLLDANGGNEQEVMLHFESKRLVVSDPDNEKVVRALPYGSITAASYTRGRRSGVFRRASHWLTIEGGGGTLVLKAGAGEIEKMVSALELRGHVTVKRIEAQ